MSISGIKSFLKIFMNNDRLGHHFITLAAEKYLLHNLSNTILWLLKDASMNLSKKQKQRIEYTHKIVWYVTVCYLLLLCTY